MRNIFQKTCENGLEIHFDGKTLEDLTGHTLFERLPVIASHQGSEQLLGVPKLERATGESIANAAFKVLEDWHITDKVQAICFDTTNTNTGHKNGAAVILERDLLKRTLFWAPCKHHIRELALKEIFQMKVGPTSGPTMAIFDRFKEAWPTIDKEKYKSGMVDEEVKKHMNAAMVDEIKEFCLNELYSKQPRDDYREFLELTILFIGGEIPNTRKRNTVRTFAPPGGCSNARWMMKAIYSLKIYLFRSEFHMSKQQIEGIREFCIFVSVLYIRDWFSCKSAIGAPNNDLKFIKNAIKYAKIDEKVSNKVLDKMSNHLWYLTDESLGLAFFDSSVSIDEKRKMVKALKTNAIERKRIDSNSREMKKEFKNKQLSDFVNANAMNFFNRFDISCDFLNADPKTWHDREDYIDGLEICSKLQVVNDCAERGVQLFTKYNKFGTKNEEDMQYTLQVINDYNLRHPSHNKKVLANE